MAQYRLLEVFGIELEYMVADKETMAVRPIADQLFEKVVGEIASDVTGDRVDWSNELVSHVVEFKNARPESNVPELLPFFRSEIERANHYLEAWNCELLPTAMHPFMNPESETKLWPHGNKDIYKTYDQIFSCRGHGWSNLQSMHINISFSTDDEFARLHSAIRAILPLVPALSSSSPIYEGKFRDSKCSRLNFYFENQKRVPSILGHVVPEVIKSPKEYQEKVLQPMYQDIAKYDTQGLLQHEWLNSRGAIPKFEYGCIEIRLADIQEAPMVDLAIASFWIEVLRKITTGQLGDFNQFDSISSHDLKSILLDTVRFGESAIIKNQAYLKSFGLKSSVSAQELIHHLLESVKSELQKSQQLPVMEFLLKNGTLSSRILRALPQNPDRKDLQKIYKRLADGLRRGVFFEA
jgi:glutamate---cysteine ligase / carboxylate-amine ligase